MIYYERYGRGLQSEVSLTESQQQGEAGYDSTKLQARLRTIRLINRPHGQHPIILTEYVPKYVEVERLRLVWRVVELLVFCSLGEVDRQLLEFLVEIRN